MTDTLKGSAQQRAALQLTGGFFSLLNSSRYFSGLISREQVRNEKFLLLRMPCTHLNRADMTGVLVPEVQVLGGFSFGVLLNCVFAEI